MVAMRIALFVALFLRGGGVGRFVQSNSDECGGILIQVDFSTLSGISRGAITGKELPKSNRAARSYAGPGPERERAREREREREETMQD